MEYDQELGEFKPYYHSMGNHHKFLQMKIDYYQQRGRDHYQYALAAVAHGDRKEARYEQQEAKYHYGAARESLIELIQMARDPE